MIGEWKLYYYGAGKNADILGGDPDAIKQIANDAVEGAPVAYYSLSGTRLAVPQKGVNIVKYKNGKVRRVLVK